MRKPILRLKPLPKMLQPLAVKENLAPVPILPLAFGVNCVHALRQPLHFAAHV
jgi:hypothetical protein